MVVSDDGMTSNLYPIPSLPPPLPSPRAKEREREAKERALQGKKGAWQDKDKDSGEESDHYWYCGVCKDGGDLLLCDGCPRSFHQRCLKLETVPEGEWKCPICVSGRHYSCRFIRVGSLEYLCDTCAIIRRKMMVNHTHSPSKQDRQHSFE
jgi:hypothetical protein